MKKVFKITIYILGLVVAFMAGVINGFCMLVKFNPDFLTYFKKGLVDKLSELLFGRPSYDSKYSYNKHTPVYSYNKYTPVAWLKSLYWKCKHQAPVWDGRTKFYLFTDSRMRAERVVDDILILVEIYGELTNDDIYQLFRFDHEVLYPEITCNCYWKNLQEQDIRILSIDYSRNGVHAIELPIPIIKGDSNETEQCTDEG